MGGDVGGFLNTKMKKLEINPQKVAKLEVNWWKAHHYGDKKSLVVNLLKHNQTLYGINIFQALILVRTLVPAAKAHNQRDKVSALKHMTEYYERFKHYLGSEMIPAKVAEAEVESWWVHDNSEKSSDKSALVKSFQRLYSNLLVLDENHVKKLAEMKTIAYTNHDKAESTKDKTVEAQYWEITEDSLVEFYDELNLVMKK